ncbi:MAG TPA: hypothetical protein VFB67_09575 [Candidatus Polarisedimenticolaceae bacterium]|nr:hypothetical protein [Candidatus Polarisedimenticolaceae bacterium]
MSAILAGRVPDVVSGCLEACRRCDAVVASLIEKDPTRYPVVGPHLRHCIEHFRLLLEGWRAGEVDYDARPRETGLERDPGSARAALAEISSELSGLATADLGRGFFISQSAAPGRPPVSSPTFLDRELLFLSSHTIHHIAIMVLAARVAGVEIPTALAVAYSTAAHHESLVTNG